MKYVLILMIFLAISGLSFSGEVVEGSCLDGDLIVEDFGGKGGGSFVFSRSCFKGRLDGGRGGLVLVGYTKNFLRPEFFKKNYLNKISSSSDRDYLREKNRIEIKMFHVSRKEYMSDLRARLIGGAKELNKTNKYLVLTNNKNSHFDTVYLPIISDNIFIGCISSCELNGVYGVDLGYSVSLPLEDIDDWPKYRDVVVNFIVDSSKY